MLGFLTSEQHRARRDAQNWLHVADKVYHFRRDELPLPELQAIQQASTELRLRLRERADAARLKMGMERLEGCLRRSGGAYYPKSTIVDYAEFFLVAAILFLGIRAFFVQPFKIPTNSMWPSYYGMTAEVYTDPEEEPNVLGRVFRLAAFGALARRVDAPVSGEIRIPLVARGDGSFEAQSEKVGTRRWLVLPAVGKRYVLYVGSTPVRVTVPADFTFERVLQEAFPDMKLAARTVGRLMVETGRYVKAGERVLSFDIMTGDQLFVDRVSYHFVRPEVGDGFVFRTGSIRGIEAGAEFTDKFYIKRLVGLPGDTLEVRAPALYRNGEPITGADAFQYNAEQIPPYPGYTSKGLLEEGEMIVVPPDSFFAMGDNSPNSSDSRFWGFVPEEDVVGRPLFIYYPFTRRWGPAP
ncbi:MAG: signal peptidase I [Opitutaceae bacterium]